MLESIKIRRNDILPTPDMLHDRSSIGTTPFLVKPGVELPLHQFESWVTDILQPQNLEKEIRDSSGRLVGLRHWHDILTSDGIDRGVTAYIPSADSRQDYPFNVVMDTAWFTGLEGHNDYIAETFMKELGVSVVVVGPEFSAKKPEAIGAQTKLGKLATLSAGFSLAKSAEASAEIYVRLKELHPEYMLSDNVVGVGESRAAMMEQIRRIYMSLRGITTLHSDLTDPNVNKQALRNVGDVADLAQWPFREAIGSLAVGAALLRRGQLHREIDTVPLNMRYMVGAILGTGPALLSGEEGTFAAYTPLDHPQHIVNSTRNSLSHYEERRKNYQNHHNTTIAPLNICHLGLGFPSIRGRVINRTLLMADQMKQSDVVDWKAVHAEGRGPITLSSVA